MKFKDFLPVSDNKTSQTSIAISYSHNSNVSYGGVKSTPPYTPSIGSITIDMLAKNSTVITQTDSLKIDTFYNCVRDKAETIGSIPFKLRKFVDGNRTLVESGREHRIFTQRPNDYMTWQGMNEMIIVTMETCGVFYAYKKDRKSVV